MSTISLCMIVKNEEDVLARCLECAKGFADEIVIVDTGSTDTTREIARQYTPLVYRYEWREDFAAARNFSFSKASMEYIMWLDADDVLEESERKKLMELKDALNPSVHMVMMPYHVAFDESGNTMLSYYRERLMLRGMRFQWEGAVHEAVSPRGNILYSDICIKHQKLHPSDPDRNLRIFERQIAEGKPLAPRERFYYARELMYHHRTEEAARIFLDFLDSGEGWIENCISACQDLAQCLLKMGNKKEALRALLRGMEYGRPRAELCCEIGRQFLEEGRPETAVFWYETALASKPEDISGGFVNPDCYGYIPCIQLCVCWDRLGDSGKAAEYNEQAGKYKPDDAAVAYNRAYFSNRQG